MDTNTDTESTVAGTSTPLPEDGHVGLVTESTYSIAYQELKEELRKVKDAAEKLLASNKTNSSIPESSDLSYEDAGSVREKFDIAATEIEKVLYEIRESEKLATRIARENRQLEIEIEVEKMYSLLYDAKHYARLAREFKSSKIPVNIEMLKLILPAEVTKSTKALRDFIMEHEVTAQFAQIAFAGLPDSGKSTLFSNIMATGSTDQDIHIQEAVLLNTLGTDHWRWIPSSKEDAEVVAVLAAIAQLGTEYCELQDEVDLEDENVEVSGPCAHLRQVLSRLKQVLKTNSPEDTFQTLAQSVLTFVNIWDIGVSKPAFELLPIIAPNVQNLVLVNLLNLARDAHPERIDCPPQLSDETLYPKHYSDRGNVLSRRSILHYYLRCVPPSCQALLVGTHVDELNAHPCKNPTFLQKLQEKLLQRAKEMHVDTAIYNQDILAINATDKHDATKVKDAIEKLILDPRHRNTVRLSWIFLRCALLERMYIRKRELIDIATKCGLQNEQEVDKWLELFQSCLSIINLPKKVIGIPDSDCIIVLNPFEFFRGLNAIYSADSQDIPVHLREDANLVKYGILSERLLKFLCSPNEDSCNLYLGLLQGVDFLTQVKAPMEGYFFPSLRKKHCVGNKSREPNSLLIIYPKEIAFDNQPILVRAFGKHLQGKIEIGKEECYNILHVILFEEMEPRAKIRIRFLLWYAEVSVTCLAAIADIHSKVKEACIEAFEETKKQLRHLNYQLAIVCPKDSCLEDENVFIEIGHGGERPDHLLCPNCRSDIGHDGRQWV